MNISMNKKQSYWLHDAILINPQIFLLCVDFFFDIYNWIVYHITEY